MTGQWVCGGGLEGRVRRFRAGLGMRVGGEGKREGWGEGEVSF